MHPHTQALHSTPGRSFVAVRANLIDAEWSVYPVKRSTLGPRPDWDGGPAVGPFTSQQDAERVAYMLTRGNRREHTAPRVENLSWPHWTDDLEPDRGEDELRRVLRALAGMLLAAALLAPIILWVVWG